MQNLKYGFLFSISDTDIILPTHLQDTATSATDCNRGQNLLIAVMGMTSFLFSRLKLGKLPIAFHINMRKITVRNILEINGYYRNKVKITKIFLRTTFVEL